MLLTRLTEYNKKKHKFLSVFKAVAIAYQLHASKKIYVKGCLTAIDTGMSYANCF